MGKEGGLADARLTGKKVNATSGEARAEDTIKLINTRGEGVAFLGGESLLDREGFGGFGGGFSGTTPLSLQERRGLDKSVPFVAGRALAGPLGKLVATTVAEEDGG